MNGDSANIVMKVGQQLTITKGSGWTNFSAKQPTSDDPTVLRVIQPAKRKVIGVFLAVKPGLADFGALSNACGSPIESSDSSTGAATPLLKWRRRYACSAMSRSLHNVKVDRRR